MEDWLYVLISVGVAAFVGGITNHYAIKMLFHPRNPVYIGKFHVPFTPGLIPKRRDDIAESLGKVVAEYLVTPEGLQESVLKPSFRSRAEERLNEWLDRWDESDLTLRDAALKVWTEEEWESLRSKLADIAKQAATRGFEQMWQRFEWGSLPLKQLIPGWSEENRKQWSRAAAEAILHVVEEELLSAAGQRMLSKMAAGMMDKAGGFLGTMAAIFMDEDKLVQKLTPALVRALRGEEATLKTARAIEVRLELYGEKPVSELLASLTGEEAIEWISGKLGGLPVDRWIQHAEAVPIRSLLGSWKHHAKANIPAVTDRLVRLIVKAIPSVIQAVRLPQLVEEQVQKFPVERLEEVILSVSGKEFRAITWLGVLLGGIIGLFQSLLMLWIG